MKYNCFDDLVNLCKLSISISKSHSICKTKTIKNSSELKNSCIIKAQKQFLPPIDREDIVRLANMIHKLNIEIVSLAKYVYFSEYSEFQTLINKGCTIIDKCLSSKPKTEINELLKLRDELCLNYIEEMEKFTYETTINTKALIKSVFFDKIEECFENTLSVIDEIIFISIKNS